MLMPRKHKLHLLSNSDKDTYSDFESSDHNLVMFTGIYTSGAKRKQNKLVLATVLKQWWF